MVVSAMQLQEWEAPLAPSGRAGRVSPSLLLAIKECSDLLRYFICRHMFNQQSKEALQQDLAGIS